MPEVSMTRTPFGPGVLTETGLELPEDLGYDEWAEMGPGLITMAQSAAWWVGDWIRYGERCFGERYVQAVEATGLKVQTLRNYVWVAERIPPSERRPDVPFSHHRAVAALDRPQREELLDRAEAEGMTEGELRGRVRNLKEAAAGGERQPEPEPDPEPEELDVAALAVVGMLVKAESSHDWRDVKKARERLERAVRGT